MAIAEFKIVNTDVHYGPPGDKQAQQYDKIAWYAQYK